MFINVKKREYLQKRHQAIHADVEARVQQLLFPFGVSAEKAVELYGEVIAAGDTLLAAYTAAVNVAEKALRKSNKAEDEVEKLTGILPFCVTTSGTCVLTLHTRCSSAAGKP